MEDEGKPDARVDRLIVGGNGRRRGGKQATVDIFPPLPIAVSRFATGRQESNDFGRLLIRRVLDRLARES